MNSGSRIVVFGSGSDQPHPAEADAPDEGAPAAVASGYAPADDWAAAESEPAVRSGWGGPAVALGAIAAWTAWFGWADRARLAEGLTPGEVPGLIAAWATPVLLICMIWLIALRTSRRESLRFAEAARLLAAESAQLESRLTVVNRELSLAREFIAAQTRDLDSLGRVAAERLSEHADRLQTLIHHNGAQVNAIADVSGKALENMERLRSHLPVIASSAKDVTNAIAASGSAAHTALDTLTEGFGRLATAGEASHSAVAGLHHRVDSGLALFEQRLEHLQGIVAARLEALEHRGEELRGRLDSAENAALDALHRRAAALGEELGQTSQTLDSNETEALTSLRARLSALRDEGTALARSLRDGETAALQALLEAKARVEAEIREVVERLEQLDRDALEAARSRIATLSEEAGNFDARLAERNRLFAAETEERLNRVSARHDAEIGRLGELFARLDDGLAERRTRQDEHQRNLTEASEAIAARLEGLNERIAAIAAFGNQAEESLGGGLRALADRMTASREALSGTESAIARLTDGSVRLLELLQASTEQSRDQLPTALASGEARLVEWEQRVGDLRGAVEAATGHGDRLAATVDAARTALTGSLDEVAALQDALGDGAGRHAATLAELGQTLATLDRDSLALAQRAQGELATAIDRLTQATRGVVATLGEETHGAVSGIATRLGEESAAAIDRAMRMRMAEAVGQLEQAAGHAAGVSREAAIQLRDQLAKVDELAGNLERRVSQARARAEEQVDNDFSRRVALITESLNSSAIDIAKALSTDVTDTAWAAYLRGDRGVFTRRAVRLMDSAEAREVARIYDEDPEFRDHVSRFIHDFEAMLRQLLATRDGHSLGVTLLSSDIGKLYVVLAQAIERLRA